MRHEIATWQERLNLRPDLAAKTIALCAVICGADT